MRLWAPSLAPDEEGHQHANEQDGLERVVDPVEPAKALPCISSGPRKQRQDLHASGDLSRSCGSFGSCERSG